MKKESKEKEEIKLLKEVLKKESRIEKEEDDLKKFETSLLKRILEKEKEIQEEEKKIEKEENRVEKILKKLYMNVNEWKLKIWNNCEEKRIVDQGDEILYMCNILKKTCTFEECPKNKI
ncbi:hypothetical protein JXB41_07285 [Candidatus Woesearchaeota archaeon]|nr:hypothetical protein [Candidatus Woesearchaeota archaeon]